MEKIFFILILDKHLKEFYYYYMMKDQSSNIKQYATVETARLLGISRNKLFFWVRTKNLVKPLKEVRGTGRGNLFSFKNLLDLTLIKHLDDAGYELNAIQWFLIGGDHNIVDPKIYEKQKSLQGAYKIMRIKRIWDFIEKNKSFYQRHGCIFLISKEKDNEGLCFVNSKTEKEVIIEDRFARLTKRILIKEELLNIIGKKGIPGFEYPDMYLIDLMRMIEDLEDKVDDKL